MKRAIQALCFFTLARYAAPASFEAQEALPVRGPGSLSELIAAVERGDKHAILDLGSFGNRSVIPLLRGIADGPGTEVHSAPSNARMALAKLGERNEFDRIVKELHSSDPSDQYNAVQKLQYVGGQDSIRVLIGLLGENTWRTSRAVQGPHGEPPQDKVIYVPQSVAAMQALGRMVNNPPIPAEKQPTVEDIPVWNKWWSDVGSKAGK